MFALKAASYAFALFVTNWMYSCSVEMRSFSAGAQGTRGSMEDGERESVGEVLAVEEAGAERFALLAEGAETDGAAAWRPGCCCGCCCWGCECGGCCCGACCDVVVGDEVGADVDDDDDDDADAATMSAGLSNGMSSSGGGGGISASSFRAHGQNGTL